MIKYNKGDIINGIKFIKEIASINVNRRGEFTCECGKIFESSFNNIKTGQVKSCGCSRIKSWIPRKKYRDRKFIYCKCGCGKSFIISDEKGRIRKFIHGHNKGHIMRHSKQAKNKMAVSARGKVYSAETNLKKGSKKERNINWKGGITPVNELIRKSTMYKMWRKAVFERDNYTCQECGEKESVSGKLNADHIKPFAYFPELRFSIENGRTLCKSCHEKTDTYLVKAKLKYEKQKAA